MSSLSSAAASPDAHADPAARVSALSGWLHFGSVLRRSVWASEAAPAGEAGLTRTRLPGPESILGFGAPDPHTDMREPTAPLAACLLACVANVSVTLASHHRTPLYRLRFVGLANGVFKTGLVARRGVPVHLWPCATPITCYGSTGSPVRPLRRPTCMAQAGNWLWFQAASRLRAFAPNGKALLGKRPRLTHQSLLQCLAQHQHCFSNHNE